MLDKILWILFYVITGLILLLFLLNEKKLNTILKDISDKISSKIVIKKVINKNIVLGINILTCFVVIGIFVFFVDKTKSDILPLRQIGIYVTVVVNAILLIANRKKEYLVILNLIMLLAGTNIFGIYDNMFKLSMAVSLPLILVSIILEKEKLKESFRVLVNGIFLIFIIAVLQLHYLGNYVIPTQSMEPTILAKDRIFSNNIIYKFTKPKLNDIISFEEPLNNQVMYTKRITGVEGTVFKIENDKIYSNGTPISDRKYSTGRDSLYQMLGLKEIYIPKKGDEVVITKVLEFDRTTMSINVLTPQEFLEKCKGQDYRKLVGLYNHLEDTSLQRRYTFVMQAKGHEQIMLPILDFKYDNKVFESLLEGNSVILKDDYYMAMGDNTDNSEDSRYFGYVKKSRIKGRLFLRWMPLNRIGFIRDEF